MKQQQHYTRFFLIFFLSTVNGTLNAHDQE
jgi:hypothetical protein